VKQAKHLLLSKNEGNLLQDFIWQTTQFDTAAVSTPGAPLDKETAKQHGDKALEGLRTLGTLLITNGQFRKLLNDAVLLIRDMAGDAAANAASRVKPSEDALASIDKPAEDNTWHDAPDFSKDNLKSTLQTAYKGDAKEDAKVAANAGANAGTNAANGQAGINEAQGTASERLNENVSEEDKQRAKETKNAAKETAAEYRARVKTYMSKKMPEERREQTIWRLKVITRPSLRDQTRMHS
jgi:hypothetical protein